MADSNASASSAGGANSCYDMAEQRRALLRDIGESSGAQGASETASNDNTRTKTGGGTSSAAASEDIVGTGDVGTVNTAETGAATAAAT
ncbi:hypothetical protein IAT40_007798 [Kwoniella sp. CBS 6097]